MWGRAGFQPCQVSVTRDGESRSAEDAEGSAEGVSPGETGLCSALRLLGAPFELLPLCSWLELAGLVPQLHPPGAGDTLCLGFYGKASPLVWVEAVEVV